LAAIEREVAAIQPKMAPLTERIADLDKKISDFAQQITGFAEESASVKNDIELTQQSLTKILSLIGESKTESEQLVAGQEENIQRCETMTAVFGAAFQAVSQFFETAQRMGLADQAKAVFLAPTPGQPLPAFPTALSAALPETLPAIDAESIAEEPASEEPAAEEVPTEEPAVEESAFEEPAVEEPVIEDIVVGDIAGEEALPDVGKDEFSVKYVLDTPDSEPEEQEAAIEPIESEPVPIAELTVGTTIEVPVMPEPELESIVDDLPLPGISDDDLSDIGALDDGILDNGIDADIDAALSSAGGESTIDDEAIPSWSASALPDVAAPLDMGLVDSELEDSDADLGDSGLGDSDLVMGATSFATDELPEYLDAESFETEESLGEPASDLDVSPLNLSVPALPEVEGLPPADESDDADEEIEAMLATMMTPITATAGG
ncbi:MAG: hypothetical protein FWG73_07085, partial [Planctomycetaceae bacterium]|nr:hypothetical protein [Planctomycetaceae bacterium]